jgi:hypothetical protein
MTYTGKNAKYGEQAVFMRIMMDDDRLLSAVL